MRPPPGPRRSTGADRTAAAGALRFEAHDEWQTSDRRYLAEDSMALLTAPTTDNDTVADAELLTA